ncbi:DUF5007 domain-containing protein [Desertivirga arenae]|uniref:DUF5007 domain-containing protein n=1 Tax=Desertivirga arenae TaxID=2810309 RepID=UPI001A95F324|nr:DUF5007 domain-containing protein [Pedobacter sp. SYSU D00823]
MSITAKINRVTAFFAAIILLSSCEKVFDLPEEKDYLSPNLNYSSKILEPILGRTTISRQGLNTDNSTWPLKFEIVNARWGDGRPVTDLFQTRPVWVWTNEYTGDEKSLEEIQAKRKLEDHPLFEVRESGEFILWASSNNDLITPRAADSSNLPQNTRYFDVKVTNTGGSVVLKDFQIRPFRERPYFPSNDKNDFTGGDAPDPKFRNNTFKKDFIRPGLSGVIGKTSNKELVSNDDVKDVVVFIRPFTGGNGHNLRIKAIDKNDVAINPSKFNETRWTTMLHAFNMVKTNEYVQYDVAYPIPLTARRTNYSDGNTARVALQYSRLVFGGARNTATLSLNFAIFREGDWEIVFKFLTDDPKFEDD